MNLYYFQPETQQEHLALIRSLNLNEKIISKQDEDKIYNQRIKFAETLVSMYQLFIEKIAKIISMGLYQRAFDLPLPSLQSMYKKPNEKTFEDDIMKLMKGFFFTLILNDPMIRFALKSYLSWYKFLMNNDKSPLNKEIF